MTTGQWRRWLVVVFVAVAAVATTAASTPPASAADAAAGHVFTLKVKDDAGNLVYKSPFISGAQAAAGISTPDVSDLTGTNFQPNSAFGTACWAFTLTSFS